MTRFSLPEYRRRFAEQCEANSKSFETNEGEVILEEHQQEAMQKAVEALLEGRTEFSIVHPCGSGKTILEAALIKSSQEAKGRLLAVERNSRKDLILTVERALMTGIREQIGKVYGRDVGIFGNGKKELEPGVVIASIQALQHHSNNLDRWFDPTRVSLVIGDEAHKFITENRAAVVNQFRNAIKIGLTATPEYPDERNITDVWSQPVHNMTLRQGVERNINVPALFYMFRNEVNGDNIPRQRGDYQRDALGKALKSVDIENAICDIYDQLPREDRSDYPALIYVPTLQIMDDVVNTMQRRFGNIRIEAWKGKTKSRKITEDREDFRRGRIDVLVLCEMGGLGLDLPRARFLIDAHPTLSKLKLEQRHGRILRTIRPGSLEAETGFEKNWATIYQILPKANSFQHPVTFLDILGVDPKEYEPHGLLPATDGRPRNPSDDHEVRRWVEHFKSRPIRSNMTLLEASDLRDIVRRDDLPSLDDNFFVYRDE